MTIPPFNEKNLWFFINEKNESWKRIKEKMGDFFHKKNSVDQITNFAKKRNDEWRTKKKISTLFSIDWNLTKLKSTIQVFLAHSIRKKSKFLKLWN